MTRLASLSTGSDMDQDPPSPEYDRISFFPDWTEESSCAGMDDTFFFGASDPDTRPQYTLTDIKNARRLCVQCPVLRECLRYSLSNRDEYGVFAGSTSNNRERMLKRIKNGLTTIDDEVDAHVEWLERTAR